MVQKIIKKFKHEDRLKNKEDRGRRKKILNNNMNDELYTKRNVTHNNYTKIVICRSCFNRTPHSTETILRTLHRLTEGYNGQLSLTTYALVG